ncbi:hypothetical protein SHIRM173S_01348 [Streptomyces hirsutus]
MLRVATVHPLARAVAAISASGWSMLAPAALMVQAWAFPAEAVSPQTLVVTEEDRATWEDQEILRLLYALAR